jgi:hypothetical protein
MNDGNDLCVYRHLSKKSYDEAETTLIAGMDALLPHHQNVAASDLGQQLIKLYLDTHKAPTDATIGFYFLPYVLRRPTISWPSSSPRPYGMSRASVLV